MSIVIARSAAGVRCITVPIPGAHGGPDGCAVVRPARPEDSRAAAPLVFETGPALMRWVFGLEQGDAGAIAFLDRAFRATRGPFSHRHAAVLEASGAVVGLALGYPCRDKARVERGLAPLLVRAYAPWQWPRVVARGLRAARLMRGVPREGYYLAHLAISVESRGRGLGWTLLDHTLGAAAAAGHPLCMLHVGVHNEGARGLYERAGFRKIGEYRDHALERRGAADGQWAMARRT